MQILLIGAGNMGFAMLQTWTHLKACQFAVIELNAELRDRAAAKGAEVFASFADLPDCFFADIVVIATKPQMVVETAAASRLVLKDDGLLVSVAAGITIGALRGQIGDGPAIIRCMPNMPATIGEGMIVCCASANARPLDRNRAYALLSAAGRVAFVDKEILMDAVTAVSGSGPAYVFHLLEAFSAAGVSVGLPPDLAMMLAKQTIFGAAKLALAPDADPAVLRERVTSPNGTTDAALSVLMNPQSGFVQLMQNAVAAAKQRANDLGALPFAG